MTDESRLKAKTKAQLIEEINELKERLVLTRNEPYCAEHKTQEAMRLQTEEWLRESEEKYKTFVENSLEGLYIIQQGKIVYCNQRLVEMFGLKSVEEAVGLDAMLLVSPISVDRVAREIAARLSGEIEVSHYNYQARSLDGKEFEVETLGRRIFYRGETAIQGVMRDISKQRQLERQLLQAQKMEAIGTLAGGIAHDFNNILSIIMGYTEISLSNLEEDEPKKLVYNLEHVLKASHRAKDLVRRILTFSSRSDSQPAAIKIVPIVQEVLKLIRASLPATIEIRETIAYEGYEIFADPTQIHQVLMNLCTNAGHAMQEKGGVLEVQISDINRDLALIDENNGAFSLYMRLTVKDSGHGMTDEVKERIFDPFFTTKSVGEGTGLGLSVVHGIVAGLDGEISVESELGQGTSFHLFLPLLQSDGKSTQDEKAKKNIPCGNERILIIDDEVALVNMAKRMLEQLCYEVVPMSNSIEALKLFKSDPDAFQLVITDITMPEMTGIQLTREIVKIRPDLPVIVCTGYSRELDRQELSDLGVKELLIKPYNKEKIGTTIRRILQGKRQKSTLVNSESLKGKNI